MNTANNGYVLGFAITVCVGMSAILAVTANSLRETQQAAAEFDRQKNVMMAAGLLTAGDPRPRKELEQLYQQRIREVVVDTKTGEVLGDKAPKDVVAINKAAADEEKKLAVAEKREIDKAAATRFRSVAIGKGEDGKSTLILPISGKGLWSTIYGYLALAEDGNTVRGVTFYKHGETPGLGGEVENPAWCAQWQGKTILGDGGKLVGIEVKKGKVDPSIPADKAHKVDGLSGATITSNGVTKFVKSDLEAFGAYLAQVRK
jgi:Na+-transporting NADH:ubiquinone oxidoreductase subunit C